MIARAIAMRAAFVMGEAAQDHDLLLERLERLQNQRQLKVRADRFRSPVGHINSVRHKDEGHATRNALDGGLGTGRQRLQR